MGPGRPVRALARRRGARVPDVLRWPDNPGVPVAISVAWGSNEHAVRVGELRAPRVEVALDALDALRRPAPHDLPDGGDTGDRPLHHASGVVRRSHSRVRQAMSRRAAPAGQALLVASENGSPEQRLSGCCRGCPDGDGCPAARPRHPAQLLQGRAGLSDRVHDEVADHRVARVVGEGGSGRTVGRTSAVAAFRVATATVLGSARPPPPSPRARTRPRRRSPYQPRPRPPSSSRGTGYAQSVPKLPAQASACAAHARRSDVSNAVTVIGFSPEPPEESALAGYREIHATIMASRLRRVSWRGDTAPVGTKDCLPDRPRW
ncbi:hypothetical protein ACVWXB_000242 [Streptomyces sp. TE12347]